MSAWPTRRDLRLGSGLVLFVYIALHLINHALGLVSLALAERCLKLAMAIWHSAPGTVVLYGAAAIHLALAFLALYQRRTLRMPPVELIRIALGFGMPLLLIGHVTATRIALELYGQMPQYARTVWSLWASDSEGRQMALLAPGWLHGCLGLHLAFHRRSWFARWRLPLFAIALLLPVLSAVGFVAMARELERVATDPLGAVAALGAADMAQRIALARLRDNLLAVYFAAIAAVFAAREVRSWMEHSRGALVSIAYPGRTVRVPRGWSVLDASRSNHIPHQSMCGGRARCSTCRVRVIAGEVECPAPEADEMRTLERIGASGDIRLACQLRPQADIAVIPLLAVEHRVGPAADTIESELVLLEADLAGWREVAIELLPQDRLFLMDAFSQAAAAAIRQVGGEANPLNGDGIIGLFNAQPGSQAAQQGIMAAAAILALIPGLRALLPHAVAPKLNIAIRMHAGLAASGSIGSGIVRTPVATGPAVDELHRMRDSTVPGHLLVSQRLFELAGLADECARFEPIPGHPPLAVTVLAAEQMPRPAA